MVAKHVCQFVYVATGDMAFVRTRVHRDASDAELDETRGEVEQIGIVPAAGIAQQSQFVEVNAEFGHCAGTVSDLFVMAGPDKAYRSMWDFFIIFFRISAYGITHELDGVLMRQHGTRVVIDYSFDPDAIKTDLRQ